MTFRCKYGRDHIEVPCDACERDALRAEVAALQARIKQVGQTASEQYLALLGRAERAEAEVERLRGLLEEAEAMLESSDERDNCECEMCRLGRRIEAAMRDGAKEG